MAREFTRSVRVAAQLQRELALLLQRERQDYQLDFVTVSDVELSRDLVVAKVYVTVMNAEGVDVMRNVERLRQLAPRLRTELSKHLRMRVMPELRFFYDDTLDRGQRIERLLATLPEARTSTHVVVADDTTHDDTG